MSVQKIAKVERLLQGKGLFRANTAGSNTTDIGIVGVYNNSAAFAGIHYRQSDGRFYLFNGLTDNPFTADNVDPNGTGYTRAPLFAGALNAAGSITASGAISTSAGSISATSGTLTGGNVQIGTNTITTTSGALTIAPTGSNSLFLGAVGQDVLLPADPTAALGAVTKQYVDNYVQGLSTKAECRARTTTSLISIVNIAGSGPTKTLTRNANGAIADDASYFDGISLVLNDRVLVMVPDNNLNNGIYYVSDAGSAGTPWVLTRSPDFNQSADINTGAYTFIQDGDTYATTGWVLSTSGTIVLETTGLTFVQFSQVGVIEGNNLDTGVGAYNVFRDKTGSNLNFRAIKLTQTLSANSTDLVEATQTSTAITFNTDFSKITATGALAAGSIASGFGTITTTNNISTSATITGGTLQTTGSALTANASTLSFAGTTGNNIVSLQDNFANALDFKVGSTSFLKFVTTTGSQSIDFGKTIKTTDGIINFANPLTATNKVQLTTNLADALSILDETTAVTYLRFDTTTGTPVLRVVGSALDIQSASTFGSDVFVNSGMRTKVQTIVGATTLGNTQSFVNADASSAAFTITLPPASGHAGRIYRIVKSDASANAVTIAVSSGDYMDGVQNDTLLLTEQYDHTTFVCGGAASGWQIY